MGFSKATGANSFFTDQLGHIAPYPESIATSDHNRMVSQQPAGGRRENVRNSHHSAGAGQEIHPSGRRSGTLVSPTSRGRRGSKV